MESPSTSGELLHVSVLEQGELVTEVVTAVRPQQITLALESQREGVEPIVTLRMATMKHGDPVKKGVSLSRVAITFVQQKKGIDFVQPSDYLKIPRSAMLPTPPMPSAVASAVAAPLADTQGENAQKVASDPPAEPPAEKKDSALVEEPGDGLTEANSQESRSISPGSDTSQNRTSRPADARAKARQADAERGHR